MNKTNNTDNLTAELKKKLASLSLQEKLGQLLVFGFAGEELSADIKEFISASKAGNVIYFARNLANNEQIKKLNQDVDSFIKKETGIRPFISLDQEGGVVSRLLKAENVVFPSAMAVRASNDPWNAYETSYLAGKNLRELGFNVNLAPVLDINSNPHNPVIGVRSYGTTAKEVIDYGLPSIKGYMDAGILPVVKHFPGHGDTNVDSHLGLPKVTKSREELWNMELAPFREAIKIGVPGIMNAHILYPALEAEELPATLSKTIMQDLIRTKLAYQGLLFSDCFEMQAISKHYGTAESFYKAIAAGMDLVLISHTPKLAKQALEIAYEAVEAGDLPIERVDESVARVLYYKALYLNDEKASPKQTISTLGEEKLKEGLGQADSANKLKSLEAAERIDYSRKLAKKIACSAVTRFDKNGPIPMPTSNSIVIGSYADRSSFVSSEPGKALLFPEYIAREFAADYLEVTVEPDYDEIMSKVKAQDLIIYGSFDAILHPQQMQVLQALAKLDIPLLVVALRNPFDLNELPPHVYKLATYDYSENALTGVLAALHGQKAEGVLAINGY